MCPGNFFHRITIHASVLISCNLQSTKLKVNKSDISRFILPNHKLCCHGNYCNDNVIIIVNYQLVQHCDSASYHIAVYVISVCTCTYTGMW